MGISSSILNRTKANKSPTDNLPEHRKNIKKVNNNIDFHNNENNIFTEEMLLQLSKTDIVSKVIILQKKISELEKSKNNSSDETDKQKNPFLIPKSYFSNLESVCPETIKAKDMIISQLERELKTQSKLIENQKIENKKKLEKYATEITELRINSSQQIAKLENELQMCNMNNANNSFENRLINKNNSSPLILKLSKKINEQADTIKELELSICRKDEIIEGFRIFEASQCRNHSSKNNKNQESNNSKNSQISPNTHNFMSKDLMLLESKKQLKKLSVSEESWFSQETLTPAINESRRNANVMPSEKPKSVKNPFSKDETKALIGLPTTMITNSQKHSNSPDIY